MSTSDQFKVEHEDHIAWLILNRPEKRNVMGASFFKEMSEHLERLDQDPAVRVPFFWSESVCSAGVGPLLAVLL